MKILIYRRHFSFRLRMRITLLMRVIKPEAWSFRPDHTYFPSGPHLFSVRTTPIFRPDHTYLLSGPYLYFVRTTPIFRQDHTYFPSGPHLYFVQTTPIFRPDHTYISSRPHLYFVRKLCFLILLLNCNF